MVSKELLVGPHGLSPFSSYKVLHTNVWRARETQDKGPGNAGPFRSCLSQLQLRPEHLLHVRDEAAVFEDGEYFGWSRREVVGFPTVLDHTGGEVDAHLITRLDRIRSISQLDHGQAAVDGVAEEDARERWRDGTLTSYTVSTSLSCASLFCGVPSLPPSHATCPLVG